MASIISGANGSQIEVVYSSSESIAGNTSAITVDLYVHRDSYATSWADNCTAYINVNGTRVMSYGGSFSIGSSWVHIGSTGSITVGHDSVGNLACNITGYFSSSITSKLTGLQVSQTVSFPNIARASTIIQTASVTIGDNFDVGIRRADSGFTHTASIFVSMSETSGYSRIKDITGITTGFNSNFTDAEIRAMFSVIPAGNTGYLQIQLYTYSGSTQIGSYTWTRGSCWAAACSQPSISGNVNIGDTMTIYMNRQRGDYTHKYHIGMGSKYVQEGGTDTNSYAWNTANNADQLYMQMTNTNVMTGSIAVDTYSHGALLGTRSCTYVAYVVNSNPSFTNFSYSDSNANSAALTGDASQIVQGVSTLQVTINGAKAINEAYISYYKVQYGSKVITSQSNIISFGSVPNNDNIVVSVVDTRGNAYSQRIYLTLIPYAAPVVSACTLQHINFIETGVILTVSGTYAHIMITKNHVALKYRYKATDSTTWTNYINIIPVLSSDSYSYAANIGNFDVSKSYNFEVVPYDYFYATVGAALLMTAKPELSIRKGRIGINKVPQQGALDIDGDIYTNNTIHADSIVASGLSIAKNVKYAEKIQAGQPVASANNFTAGHTFCYACDSPYSGALISFGGLNQLYDCQINAGYNSTAIAHRTRDGDHGWWNGWQRFYDDSYRPYADSAGRLNAPRASWYGTILTGHDLYFTHNLNTNAPIMVRNGTVGNCQLCTEAVSANQTRIHCYGNDYIGYLYFF